MRRILVVANQTLGGDQLAELIRSRIAAQPTEFSLLVPATHRTELVVVLAEAFAVQGGMRPPSLPVDDDVRADERMTAGVEWMRGLGATVTGQVGQHDAARAVHEHLTGHRCDEIIISTLPHGISSWLRQDLPHRVERDSKVPVTVISAKDPKSG